VQEPASQKTVRPAVDLEAYFRRIGYDADRAPTLDTLRTIQLRHAETIAFENLNPLMRWPVPLSIESIQQKLVRDGRGGYCFEQNLLLKHVLTALGFQVTGLAARVLWDEPDSALRPRSHMLLLVELKGTPYLVDVGFGILTPTAPLRLQPEIEQATPHEPFRLLPAGEEFVMHAKIRGEWKTLYRFGLQEQLLPDYEVSNWYLSNHPESLFVTGLMAARPASGRRYALRNNEFVVHHLNGGTERRALASVAEMRDTLERAFCITVPNGPDVDAALAKLVS
jgi:N-hydroxyarylamine O-acetyltransferase